MNMNTMSNIRRRRTASVMCYTNSPYNNINNNNNNNNNLNTNTNSNNTNTNVNVNNSVIVA